MNKTKTDKWGKWQQTPKGSWILIEPSQKHSDEIMRPLHENAIRHRVAQDHGIMVSKAMTRLGEGRSNDSQQAVAENKILRNSIAEISETELYEIAPMFKKIGSMSFQELDDYIEQNVTDLASARAFLKNHAKVTLATMKLLWIFMRRESIPEEE